MHTVRQGAFAVDRYEWVGSWLYTARPLVDQPRISYMEVYLLPALGLQVNRWQHYPNSDYAPWYDFYVDITAFDVEETCRTSRDFYLDVVVVEGRGAYIADTDEFVQAQAEGLLAQAEAAHTLNTAHTLLNGLAEHGYSLEAYL